MCSVNADRVLLQREKELWKLWKIEAKLLDLDCSYQKWAKENEGHEICICYWWSTVFALFARLGITRTFKTCQHNVRPSLACRAPIVQIGLENEISLLSFVNVEVSEAKNKEKISKQQIGCGEWTKIDTPHRNGNFELNSVQIVVQFSAHRGKKSKLRWKGIWMAKWNKRENLNLVGLV